jgi:hypothetical protein
MQLGPITQLAGLAADPTSSITVLQGNQRSLTHAAGGLAVLFVVQVLGVYKPQGMTRYGWRKQHERRPVSQPS